MTFQDEILLGEIVYAATTDSKGKLHMKSFYKF